MKKMILNPIGMVFTGLIFGFLAKWFDIHTEILGNIFSQLPIWILIGVLIAVYSKNEMQAMIHVLLFSLSMLNSYYVCAELWKVIYGVEYIQGWSIFALCTPLFAYFAWFSKEKGIFAKVVSLLICFVSLVICILLYGMNIINLMILTVLIYFVLLVDVERN